MGNNKLLTLNDLYNFYSLKKKSMNFDCKKSGYNVVVQTEAKLLYEEDDLSEGLLYTRVKAFHDLTNNNLSHIKTDVFKEKAMSIKDRPVMADIIDTGEVDENGNPIMDFSGHSMSYDEDKDKFIYKEIPVGHFVNPEGIEIVYDEEYERNFAISDAVIYEEYTEACEILRRRKEVDCSVELVIRSMSWNNTDKVLVLNDFYVQGCTLLGEGVLPGMSGSKVQLKDFSEERNSLFYSINSDISSKLIDTLDNLNNTLSSLNINNENNKLFKESGEEVEQNVNKEFDVENEVNEVVETEENNANEEVVLNNESEETEDVVDVNNEVETETEVETEEDTDDKADDEDDQEDTDDVDESDDVDSTDTDLDDVDDINDDLDPDDDEDDEKVTENNSKNSDTETYSITFELSHDDIRRGLYELLEKYEDDWCWIVCAYDDRFIYEKDCKFYGRNYTKNGDEIELVGDAYNIHAEYLTDAEYEILNEMRSNYSSISNELAQYKRVEEINDKKSVFESEDYSAYLDTDEFKSLMSEDNLLSLTKDELIEKADAIIGKFARTKKIEFSLKDNKETENKFSFAFAGKNTKCSFLDGLLNKK